MLPAFEGWLMVSHQGVKSASRWDAHLPIQRHVPMACQRHAACLHLFESLRLRLLLRMLKSAQPVTAVSRRI